MREDILINILSIVRQNESHKIAKSMVLNFERVAGNTYTLDILIFGFKINTIQKIRAVLTKYKQCLAWEVLNIETARAHFNLPE